jgi:hypothetical protein
MRRFAAVLAVTIVLLGSGLAYASVQVQVGDWLVLSTGNGAVPYGDGGEFEINVYKPDTFSHDTGGYDNGGYYGNYHGAYSSQLLGSFYTFCASQSLYFVPGYAYQVTSLTEASSLETSLGGWLFAKYWLNHNPNLPGSLEGYVPGHDALLQNASIGGMTNTSIAGAIQDEIWKSLGFNYQFGNLHATAETTFGWALPEGYSAGTIDKLMLYAPQNNYGCGYPGGQPQLYIPSSGTNIIPEPATMVVWLLLAAASWLGMKVCRRGRRVGQRGWPKENRAAILAIIFEQHR